MRKLDGEATPALVLDRERLEHNRRGMIARCRALGVGLRPPMKTLKSIDAARVAIDPEHGGIAVATLNEAEYFAACGLRDIQYAVCICAGQAAQGGGDPAARPGVQPFPRQHPDGAQRGVLCAAAIGSLPGLARDRLRRASHRVRA